MSPPTSLSACPPEIREHPLPGDRCTAPSAVFHPPETRFRRLSLVLEAPAFSMRSGSSAGVDFRYRTGINGIFRPHRLFNLGLGIDTDYTSELTLMGRVGANLPLHRNNMYGFSFNAVAGLRQVFGQQHAVGGGDVPVSGSLFSFGGEISFNVQMWNEFSFVLPYFRFLASTPADVGLDLGGRGNLPWGWQMQFGIGLSFDFLPGGN